MESIIKLHLNNKGVGQQARDGILHWSSTTEHFQPAFLEIETSKVFGGEILIARNLNIPFAMQKYF